MKSMYQEYDPCPRCETDLLVEGFTGYADYICHGCGETFDRGDGA